jgi:diguanylate cyclase (GGDEF)-like protein
MLGMKLDGSNLLIRKEIIRLINSRVYLVKFPRALERQYSHQYKTEAAREYRVRAVIIMGLYLYLSAGIYQTIPISEVKSWLMLYGWVGVIVFITWTLSLFKQAAQWFDLYTCIGSSLAIAISFAMTSILDGGGNILYHAAMMYAVVIIYGFVGMRFYTATIAGWSGGVIGLLITMHFHGQLEWTLLQRTYTFSSFLGMCLAYATDHQHRQNYLQSCLIEQTRLKMVDQAKQLESLSQRDALTGLANRRYLDEVMTSEWNRAIRYKTPLTVMMIDIDYFKNYNDTLGHLEGDRCLKIIADSLAKCAARSGDLAARYGGEEFLLLFASTDREPATKQAERLVHLIQELAILHPASPVAEHMTISIGVACAIPQIHEQPAEFIRKSDAALYKAKTTGRNRFVIAD